MTTPTTDAQQFEDRYGVKESVDKLRDGLYNPGSSVEEHMQSVRAVDTAVPGFGITAAFALGAYLNNQPGEVDPGTVEAVVYLMKEYGEEARTAAFDNGADVLGGALNDLGIALRKAGKLEWEDKTPDEGGSF